MKTAPQVPCYGGPLHGQARILSGLTVTVPHPPDAEATYALFAWRGKLRYDYCGSRETSDVPV